MVGRMQKSISHDTDDRCISTSYLLFLFFSFFFLSLFQSLLLFFFLCLLCHIRTATSNRIAVASESTQFGSGAGFLVVLNPLCCMLVSEN